MEPLQTENVMRSVPTILEFDPTPIKFQNEVIDDIRHNFDYSNGPIQILLSGAAGSSKSLLMAHIIATHCFMFSRSNVGIGRLSKPSLKQTLCDKIYKHLEPYLDKTVFYSKVTGGFEFNNGSKITTYSWADTNWSKVRSEEFSLFAIEELTENDDKEFYYEILLRLGRLRHVPECLLISATNPDEPDHWVYKEIIEKAERGARNIKVYYSKTSDNRFLPPSYIQTLYENLDALLVERFVNGKWISIRGDKIYYNYDKDRNFINQDYTVKTGLPICFSFDFNIGVGKPMSMLFFQRDFDGVFHCFDEVIVEGADTENLLTEAAARDLFDYPTLYYYYGDATGRARHTASKKSDYDVIEKFLSNYRTKRNEPIRYIGNVPLSNPPIRTRHNEINSLCKNSLGKVKLLIYKKCITLDEGLRLCKLLPGAKYIEDDSKKYQHITTALGYAVNKILKGDNIGVSKTIQL